MRVHHIGYYVKNLEAARDAFAELGFAPVSEIVVDDVRKIDIQFLKNDTICVELIFARGGCDLFPKTFQKQGSRPYHVCYIVSNLDETVKSLEEKGFLLVRPPACAVALGGRQVVFLYSEAVGLVELLEEDTHDNRGSAGKAPADF